jgi:hypothetical protein
VCVCVRVMQAIHLCDTPEDYHVLNLTARSWSRCCPKHGTKTTSWHGGHGVPGVDSMCFSFSIFFLVGFRVKSGFGGEIGP